LLLKVWPHVYKEYILDFEFSICKGDVWGFLIDSLADEDDSKENKQNLIWFTGTIDRYSGKVISAAIGRRIK
jgi:hypothetical protein